MTEASSQKGLHSLSHKAVKQRGRIRRGTATGQMNNSYYRKSQAMQRQIMHQLEYLPKLKDGRKRMNKSLAARDKIQQIIIMESGVFPSIYFRKANLSTVLKEFSFPDNVKGLPPKDQRVMLISQIVFNLFNEITFFAFNLLMGQDTTTGSIYVFFSDAQTIPYSKCCNLPVYVQLCQNGSGRVLCNSSSCESNILAEFLISFQDGKKLWKHLRYFSTASFLDKKLRSRISKLISNGKHRRMNLVSVIQDTSRQIAELLENQQKQDVREEQQNYQSATFLTGAKGIYYQQENNPQPSDAQISDTENISKNLINQLPNRFMSHTYSEFQSKISQSLVNEGKVFAKDFELIKRIDQQLLDKKRTKNTTAINFPRLMSEFHRDKKKMRRTDELQQIKSIVNNSIL